MPEDIAQEKTEQPTPKRREDARKKGNVARSMEINAVSVLLAGLVILYFFGPTVFGEFGRISKAVYGNLDTLEITRATVHGYLTMTVVTVLKLLAPLVSSIMVVGLIANYLQVGPIFTVEPMIPKLERINPINGLKRLFSLRSLFELIKGIFKIGIIAYVSYLTFKGVYREYIPLVDKDVGQIVIFISKSMFTLAVRVAIVLILLALLDYAYQRWDYEKNLRMTRYELREEYRQMEGHPQIKARIRSIQREMARRRMMERVPDAEVVITNPAELAVALQYDVEKMAAPTVVAKGARLLAQRIKEIAQEHDVPMVEDRPLAQMLYKNVEVDGEIPYDLYEAVAEILAYVYRLKGVQVAV